jgi:uncharacterized damage-inducible protein DinB
MIVQTLQKQFKRDLLKLKKEVELYRNEKKLWIVERSIANSAGNLALHLIGNLNAYIGVGLGQTGYVRTRDLEFSLKDIPRSELLTRIDETMSVVENGLARLTTDDLEKDFPILIWEKPEPMDYTLVHLLSHLNYHLGQINYHRRLLDD